VPFSDGKIEIVRLKELNGWGIGRRYLLPAN